MKMQTVVILLWMLGLLTDVSGDPCQRCCPSCVAGTVYCCPFGYTCNAAYNGECVPAEFTDDEDGGPCNRVCDGNCDDGPITWCRYGYTCSADDDTGVCKPIVPLTSTMSPTSTSSAASTISTTSLTTSSAMTTQSTSTTTQPTSTTTTMLQASTSISNSCTKCSITGILPPAPPDCCPFSLTCDQPGGGTCISAEPSNEGGNNPPCLRVKGNGDKIWCHFGTTCSTSDGTGVCKPLQGTTTVETTPPTTQPTSTTTTAQPTSTTTTPQPTSTTTTQPTSTTTALLQDTTSVSDSCKKCSATGIFPLPPPPDCCPFSLTCDQPGGGTCIPAEPSSDGGDNPPCLRRFGGGKIWCHFGTTCSRPDGTGVCVPLKADTTTETPSSTTQPTSTTTTTQPVSTTTTPQSTPTTTTQPTSTTTALLQDTTSVSDSCKKCSATGIFPLPPPPDCCPFSLTCDQPGGGTCIPAEPSSDGGDNPPCLRRFGGGKIWCHFGTTCSRPDGTGVCVPLKADTTTETPSSTTQPTSTTTTTQPTTTASTTESTTTITTTQPTSTTTTTQLTSSSISDSCRKCSGTGIFPPPPRDCCPFSQTCDQPGGGTCISAEPSDAGGNNPPCLRVYGGGKIWCHFGTTCSRPDGTGVCKPLKTDTTTEESSTEAEPTSSLEVHSTTTPTHPTSTTTTQPTSTTTETTSTTSTALQVSTSVSNSCTKCSTSGIFPPAPPDCCPFSKTCDQPGGGTCISAEPSGDGGNNPPCRRVRANGDKLWCHFGTTCSTPDGTGVCKPLQGTTTVESTAGETSSTSIVQSTSTTTMTAQASSTTTTQLTSSTTTTQPTSTTTTTQPTSTTTTTHPSSTTTTTQPSSTTTTTQLTSTTTTTQPTSTTTTMPPTSTTLYTSTLQPCRRCCPSCTASPSYCCPYGYTCTASNNGVCVPYPVEQNENPEEFECSRVCNACNGPKIWCKVGYTCSSGNGNGRCKQV